MSEQRTSVNPTAAKTSPTVATTSPTAKSSPTASYLLRNNLEFDVTCNNNLTIPAYSQIEYEEKQLLLTISSSIPVIDINLAKTMKKIIQITKNKHIEITITIEMGIKVLDIHSIYKLINNTSEDFYIKLANENDLKILSSHQILWLPYNFIASEQSIQLGLMRGGEESAHQKNENDENDEITTLQWSSKVLFKRNKFQILNEEFLLIPSGTIEKSLPTSNNLFKKEKNSSLLQVVHIHPLLLIENLTLSDMDVMYNDIHYDDISSGQSISYANSNSLAYTCIKIKLHSLQQQMNWSNEIKIDLSQNEKVIHKQLFLLNSNGHKFFISLQLKIFKCKFIQLTFYVPIWLYNLTGLNLYLDRKGEQMFQVMPTLSTPYDDDDDDKVVLEQKGALEPSKGGKTTHQSKVVMQSFNKKLGKLGMIYIKGDDTNISKAFSINAVGIAGAINLKRNDEKGDYNLAIDLQTATTPFHLYTKMLTITNRYHLKNNLAEAILIREYNTKYVDADDQSGFILQPQQVLAFHWSSFAEKNYYHFDV